MRWCFIICEITAFMGLVAVCSNQIEPIIVSAEPSDFSKVSNLLFEETFEGEDPLWNAHDTDFGTNYAFNVVDEPVYMGNKAGRFELRASDPLVNNGKRAEVVVVIGSELNERWYSFAVYLPSKEFGRDSQQEIISQWHQRADKHLGEDGQSPSTALRIKKDRFYLDTGYNAARISEGVVSKSRKKIDIGPVTKDAWHEFVIHFIHSYGSDGLIELWHNGSKVIEHKGGNMYNNMAFPKWKLGVYKASFKSEKSDVNKRVLYFDNIRVGNRYASFQEMDPRKEITREVKN